MLTQVAQVTQVTQVAYRPIMPAMWPFPGNCTVGIALGIYEFDETGNIRIQ